MASKQDKENPQAKSLTKIPVRTQSNLTKKLCDFGSIVKERQPLVDIQPMASNGNRPLPSEVRRETVITKMSPKGSIYSMVKSKTEITLNEKNRQIMKAFKDRTKNVTIRSRDTSPLDWNLQVFQSSGRSQGQDTVQGQGATQGQLDPREARSKSAERSGENGARPITPANLLQHNRVKNIKRSLKRPSSKELQNKTKDADLRSEAAPLIQRDLPLQFKCDFESIDRNCFSLDLSSRDLTLSYERSIIKYLLQRGRESKSSVPKINSAQRSIVLNWLVKLNSTQNLDSGSAQVIQIAARHLDKVLALDTVPIERVQLLAAACYWIAQKQCAKPKYASCITRHSAGAFLSVDLIAAEKYVLRRLNWPRIPVVADDFVPYLILVTAPADPQLIDAGATFLCTASLLDVNLSALAPELLALAAVATSVVLLENAEKVHSLYATSLCRVHTQERICQIQEHIMTTIVVMKIEKCPCREPYVQYSKPPLQVAQKLAEKAQAIMSSRARKRGES